MSQNNPDDAPNTPDTPDTPVVAVVLAAGFGTRFDPANPKQLVSVGGKPIVCRSIEAFERNGNVTDIVVVVNPTVRAHVEQLVDEAGYPKVRAIIDGGRERADSTLAALSMLAAAGIPDRAKLLIHDAVRPFVAQESIDGCVAALDAYEAATVAIPSTDTILLTRDAAVGASGAGSAPVASAPAGSAVDSMPDASGAGPAPAKVIASVPERPDSYRAQTPQAFRFDTLRRAYRLAEQDPAFHPTDDTRVVVDYLPGIDVAIVPGGEENLKITTPPDLPAAERIAARLEGRPAPDETDGLPGAVFGRQTADADGSALRPMSAEEAKARMHAVFAAAAQRMR